MKKIVFIALLFSSVFLIGSVAAGVDGVDGHCQDYLCTGTVTCDGQIVEIYEEAECATVCYEDYTALLLGPDLGCTLGLINNKNMVGACDSDMGLLGCSAQLHGRILEINFYLVEDPMYDCVIEAKCTPCTNCCDDK
jgi:hypothetical protein